MRSFIRLFRKKTGAKDRNGKNIRVGDFVRFMSHPYDDDDGTIRKSKVYPGAFWIEPPNFDCDGYGCGDEQYLLGRLGLDDLEITDPRIPRKEEI